MVQVMVVDDYEIFRKQLKRQNCIQTREDIEIAAEADNGQEALDYLRHNTVDILLSTTPCTF